MIRKHISKLTVILLAFSAVMCIISGLIFVKSDLYPRAMVKLGISRGGTHLILST